MGFSPAPIEQIGWFERCENSPCLNRHPINSDVLEGVIRNPIQHEEVVGRAFSGSVCSLPLVMVIMVLRIPYHLGTPGNPHYYQILVE